MAYDLQNTLPKLFTHLIELNPSQIQALSDYTTDSLYPFVNRITRNKITADSHSNKRLNDKAYSESNYLRYYDRATSVLRRFEEIFNKPKYVFKIKTILYRSIDKKYIKNFIKGDELYSTYQDDAYTSTTIDLNMARIFKDVTNFKTKLYLLPGITYDTVPIGDISRSQFEKEVLLNKNYVYFYIGKVEIQNNLYIKNILTDIKTTLHEFILLPSMDIYNKIGRPMLERLGKQFHQESVDILNSVEIYQETATNMLTNKYAYISELEYLVQIIVTNLTPIKNKSFGMTIYSDFEINARKIQRQFFGKNFTDIRSLQSIFTEKYLLIKQIYYIQWIEYLIKINLLDIPRYIKVINLPSIKTKEQLVSHLNNMFKYDKKDLENILSKIQNEGGSTKEMHAHTNGRLYIVRKDKENKRYILSHHTKIYLR